jgi:hypothetical protein
MALAVAGAPAGARADVVVCDLTAGAEASGVRLHLFMSPSHGGMSPFSCPDTSRLARTVNGDSEVVVADWSNDCDSGGDHACDCGEWVDACVPAGAVEYVTVEQCGTMWMLPSARAEVVVTEGCDASGGGCECSATASPTIALGLPLLAVWLCLGALAYRRASRP